MLFPRCTWPKQSALIISVALALSALSTPLSAASPFSGFYGTWSGRGNAIFNGGAREALLCKGYYTGKGNDLRLALRCASKSNKIDLRAKLSGTNTTIQGTWEERTFNAEGSVVGTLSGKKITARLNGGIVGTLKLSLGAGTQLVSLNTAGGTLSGVHLKLKRR